MRGVGSCEVFLDDVFVPDDLVLGEPGNGLVHAAGDAQQRADHASPRCAVGIIDGVLEDAVDYVKQREAFGKHDRQLPGHPALHRRHRDVAEAGRADRPTTPRGCRRRDSRAASRRTWPRSSRPSTPSRPPTSASRSSAAWATPRRPTCSATGATHACYRIGPITNEMARNSIAEVARPAAVVLTDGGADGTRRPGRAGHRCRSGDRSGHRAPAGLGRCRGGRPGPRRGGGGGRRRRDRRRRRGRGDRGRLGGRSGGHRCHGRGGRARVRRPRLPDQQRRADPRPDAAPDVGR